jgi:hypothetical protein
MRHGAGGGAFAAVTLSSLELPQPLTRPSATSRVQPSRIPRRHGLLLFGFS